MLLTTVNAAIIAAIVLLSVPTVDSLRIGASRNGNIISRTTILSSRATSRLNMAKDRYQSMEVDESKLSPSEVERLAFIRKLTLEADEIVKAAGLSLEDEELDQVIIRKGVKDTDWSGQSDVEESIRSSNNIQDVINRKGLAAVDIISLIASSAAIRSYSGKSVDLIGVLGNSFPFIAAWLLITPFLGTFSRDATESKEGVPKGLLLGSILSALLAASTSLDFTDPLQSAQTLLPSLPVTLFSVTFLLTIGRVLFISLIGETSEKEYKSAGFFEVFKMIKSLVKRW